MPILLRQSTASQEIPLGYFLDTTDGDTEETGLSISNTDIQLWKTGATALANKNSGGGTHISNGIYYATLDATDTNTLGSMIIYCHMSGALATRTECLVVPANIYDSLVAGTDYLQVDGVQVEGGDATDAINAACDSAISDASLATAAALATVDTVVDSILADTGTDGVKIAADAITASTFDESTAYPLTSADSGATAVARTGADADTLETLSDQLDGVGGGDATEAKQDTIIAALGVVDGNVDSILEDTGTTGVLLADDAITASKYDEATAYPLTSADSGSTAVARTGADGDTLETLSDQLDGVGGGDATEAKQDTIIAALAVVDGIVDDVLEDTGTTLPASLSTIDSNVDAILLDTGTDGVVLADDAITSAKYDETTAYPITSADTGATEIARTGADGDTLETLSDQLDVAGGGDATEAKQDTIIAALGVVDGNVDSILEDTGTTGVVLADDAITSAKYDESTAYPIKSADTGSTEIARTGADGDTLETLSDQLDGAGGGDATEVKQDTIIAALATVDGNVDSILEDTGTTGVVLADDAITSAKYDESTAYPITSADTGATEIARTGADGDTLETLSDQLDLSGGGDATEAKQDTIIAALGVVDGNVDAILLDTGTDGVVLADDAITSAKYDEATAYPLTSADTGATEVARTGADGDTLETLSDQVDLVGGGGGDATAANQATIIAALGVVDGNVDSILEDTGTTGVILADDSITSAKYDETTAYPLTSADSGSTAVARTGADADTLETLSDQVDAVASGGDATEAKQDIMIAGIANNLAAIGSLNDLSSGDIETACTTAIVAQALATADELAKVLGAVAGKKVINAAGTQVEIYDSDDNLLSTLDLSGAGPYTWTPTWA